MKLAPWLEDKIKMPKGRPSKDINKYIDRIYEHNKATINTTIDIINNLTRDARIGDGITDPKLWFKRTIQEIIKKDDISIKEAVKLVSKSSDFTSYEDRKLFEIHDKIKDPGNFDRFRRLVGYNKQIDWNNLTFGGKGPDSWIYYYGNIMIELPYDSEHGHLNFTII